MVLILGLLSSCIANKKDLAELSTFTSVNKKTFSFAVSDKFILDNSNSDFSKLHPKMKNSELKLLISFLKKNNYCINNKGKLLFKINSKQEKIYDVTFSGLIEQNYNPRPVSPVIYFGECV